MGKKAFNKKSGKKQKNENNIVQSTDEIEEIKPEIEQTDETDETEKKIDIKKEEGFHKREKSSNENDHEYTVFIKNISYDSTNEDLEECFKKFGPIKYALVVRDPVSGHSKGTGFVKFLKKESVSICLQQSGKIVLQYFTLEILPSVPRSKIKEIETEKEKEKHEPKDKRNLYLIKEGTILAGSQAAEGVSATDMATRLRLEQIKSSMLKNLNRFISRERLTIHNLPEHIDDEKLRKIVISRTNLKVNGKFIAKDCCNFVPHPLLPSVLYFFDLPPIHHIFFIIL
jgi:nucleolar protein 4